ncbi:MAG: hypothetical protein ACRBBJ_12610 [Rhodomicrobiaceae bacterium]
MSDRRDLPRLSPIGSGQASAARLCASRTASRAVRFEVGRNAKALLL